MAATLKGIAQAAGVSAMTVSRVLSGKAGNKVSAELSDSIRRLALEMGYRPNRLAKAMRTGTVPLAALCLHRSPEQEKGINLYWYDLIVHFTRALEPHRIEVLFVPYNTPEELEERIGSLRSAGLIGGVISNLIPGMTERTCDILKQIALPYVLLGNPQRDDIPCTYVDGADAYRELERLAKAAGARELRQYGSGDPLPSPQEAQDAGIFWLVPGELERNWLIRRGSIAPDRLLLCAGMDGVIAGSGGYVLDHRTAERCRESVALLLGQMEPKCEIAPLRRIIRLGARDIRWVEPF